MTITDSRAAQLIVKRTFLEFVDGPASKGVRSRAMTDSQLSRSCGNDCSRSVDDSSHTSVNEERLSEASLSTKSSAAQVEWPAIYPGQEMYPFLPCQMTPQFFSEEAMQQYMNGCYPWGCDVEGQGMLPQMDFVGNDWAGDTWDTLAPESLANCSWLQTSNLDGESCQLLIGTNNQQSGDKAKVYRDEERWADSVPASHQVENGFPADSKTDAHQIDLACSEDEFSTTVMLRNLPNNYTRTMLMELIDAEGYAHKYDFVYLPIDFNSKAGLGYGFVNLISPEEATRFWKDFEGFSRWALPSDKVCCLNWSRPHQGLESHIERYRNSPVMHVSVPDICKPMIFSEGVRVPFPGPTRPVKAPRLRVRN